MFFFSVRALTANCHRFATYDMTEFQVSKFIIFICYTNRVARCRQHRNSPAVYLTFANYFLPLAAWHANLGNTEPYPATLNCNGWVQKWRKNILLQKEKMGNKVRCSIGLATSWQLKSGLFYVIIYCW